MGTAQAIVLGIAGAFFRATEILDAAEISKTFLAKA